MKTHGRPIGWRGCLEGLGVPRERDLAQTLRYYAGPHLSKSAENFAHAIKGGLEFFSPAGDVKDLVSSAQDTSRNVMAGDPVRALASTLMMGAALGGMAIPGPPVSKIGKGAGDLTDALRKAADDLPMDEASRMARAKAQGFDVDAFRGAKSVNEDLRVPAWFSSDVNTANTYAGARRPFTGEIPKTVKEGAQIQPVKMRISRPKDVDFVDIAYVTPQRIEELKKEGFDSLRSVKPSGEVWYVPFSNKQVRSRFAKFDPAKTESADILAGLAPLGLAAPFAGQLFPKGDEEK